MKLWLISQSENDGYDTYDSAVVCAASEDEARLTHPAKLISGDGFNYQWAAAKDGGVWIGVRTDGSTYSAGPDGFGWCDPKHVSVRLIGDASDGIPCGAVCASFNAG